MDQLLHPLLVATPALVTAAAKKSKILLLSITIPLFPMAVVVVEPLPRIALLGRFAPAGPILQFEMVLLSLPLAVLPSVLKKTVAPFVATELAHDPCRLQFVIVLFVAPPMNRIVLVPEVADAVVFEIVSELPPVFRPLMVTLSAPLRLISGLPAVVEPVTVRAPTGVMVNEVQEPAFKPAVAVPSSVSPKMVTLMLLPVWVVLAFNASKAPLRVV